jgi:hypothetical protein
MPAVNWDIAALQQNPVLLHRAWCEMVGGRWPGRGEALVKLARLLGERIPEREYVLPEETLDWLLDRARQIRGSRVPVRGDAGHKGRVGDAVEKMLLGARPAKPGADHPAAEIKSVPVLGDKIVERVKLGVVNEHHNPLDKCDRILFVFVEQRGRDYFVRDFEVEDFDWERWERIWGVGRGEDGRSQQLIETAAGSSRHPARGLYLTPHFFYDHHLWPR